MYLLLRLVPLPYQVLLLLGRQVPSPELVFANPGYGLIPIVKGQLLDGVGQFRVLRMIS